MRRRAPPARFVSASERGCVADQPQRQLPADAAKYFGGARMAPRCGWASAHSHAPQPLPARVIREIRAENKRCLTTRLATKTQPMRHNFSPPPIPLPSIPLPTSPCALGACGDPRLKFHSAPFPPSRTNNCATQIRPPAAQLHFFRIVAASGALEAATRIEASGCPAN